MKARIVSENLDFERGQDPYTSLDIGKNVDKRKLISAARIYADENIPTHYYPQESDFIEFAETTLSRVPEGFVFQHILDDIGDWWDEWWEDRESNTNESLDFERGQDPKSAIGIGQDHVIFDKWGKLQMEKGIGVMDLKKSLNAKWHFTVHVSEFAHNAFNAHQKIIEYFGDYLSEFYNMKVNSLEIMIKPEYVNNFIRAYNMRYPDWPKEINESTDFERGGDTLKTIDIGKKRNIPDYHRELSNDIMSALAKDINSDINTFYDELITDLLELGYGDVEGYLEFGEEREYPIQFIENGIKKFKWAIEEYVKEFVWEPEVIKSMSKAIYEYMTISRYGWYRIEEKIDRDLKRNWGIDESMDFERGEDPYDSLNIGNKIQRFIDRAEEKAMEYGFREEPPLQHGMDKTGNNTELKRFMRNSGEEVLIYRYNRAEISPLAKDELEDIYVAFRARGMHNYDFSELDIWTKDHAWRETFGKLDIDESLDFERGQDPKRALRVGQREVYPDADLFEQIHAYCKNAIPLEWPKEFESIDPIDWAVIFPNFKVNLKGYKEEDPHYQFFLKKDRITVYYHIFVDAGGGRRSYKTDRYKVKDFDHFVRILQSNHAQYIMGESLDFERGQDPKEAMGIGNKDAQLLEKLRNLGYSFGWKEVPMDIIIEDNNDIEELFQWENHRGEQLLFYKMELAHKTFYELAFYHIKQDNVQHTEYFQNEDILDPDKIWFYYNRMNETLDFERGGDVKSTLGIGQVEVFWKKLLEDYQDGEFELDEDEYQIIENDYDTHNLAILQKLYKILDQGKIYKTAGNVDANEGLVLYTTPYGPIFSWGFDYGMGYATPVENWPGIEKAIKEEIPLTQEELMMGYGYDKEDLEDPMDANVLEDLERLLQDSEVAELITK